MPSRPFITAFARQRTARGEVDICLNAQGAFTVKRLDRRSEGSILVVNSIAFGKAVEERTQSHHGDVRSAALACHHAVVLGLEHKYDWDLVMEYDTQQ